MGRALAQKHGMQFAEVSAKTGDNVKSAIDDFILSIVRGQVTVLAWKDVYMIWLLFINVDFDDDLLQDIMEMVADE